MSCQWKSCTNLIIIRTGISQYLYLSDCKMSQELEIISRIFFQNQINDDIYELRKAREELLKETEELRSVHENEVSIKYIGQVLCSYNIRGDSCWNLCVEMLQWAGRTSIIASRLLGNRTWDKDKPTNIMMSLFYLTFVWLDEETTRRISKKKRRLLHRTWWSSRWSWWKNVRLSNLIKN